MNKVDAIILAGAPAGRDMNPGGSTMSRAMIGLGDKTMLQWVVDALCAAPSVGRIAAVGRVDANGLDLTIEPGEDLITNIKLGIESLKPEGNVLVVSSDIPLITAQAIEDFIERAYKVEVDLAYPILPKAHCVKRYPDLQRTYLKTSEGVFTGGNIMLAGPRFFDQCWGAVAKAYASRKSVFKLAQMIGMGVLLRVLVAQVIPQVLSVSMLERAVSRMLGAKVAAVVSAHPEIGEDVDKASDLEVVRRILVSSERA